MTTTREPTPGQLRVLSALRALLDAKETPTRRMLQARLGLASVNAVQEHLLYLREKRLVEWVERRPGTLRLTAAGVKAARAAS